MFVDGRSLGRHGLGPVDVCILGAGAAGITLARQLSHTNLRVLLVESGGFEPEPATQALNKGTIVGRDYWALHTSRLRYFGGTTNHWVGWCRPLDPIDFQQRPWVPDSGWPISYEDLLPYYAVAQRLCELGPFDYLPERWVSATKQRPLSRELPGFHQVTWQFSPPTRFGKTYRTDLEQAENLTVLLRTNAVALGLSSRGSEFQRVTLRCLGGPAFEVEARACVLALGGLENARLLLASTDFQPYGVGNRFGNVGRFFADHPHSVMGVLMTDAAPEMTRPYVGIIEHPGGRPAAVRLSFALDEEMQRQHRLLGVSLSLEPPKRTVFQRREGLGINSLMEDLDERRLRQTFELFVRAEQAPTSSSRVLLADSRDELGMRRIALSWVVGEQTLNCLKQVMELFAAAVGQIAFGRVYSYAHSGRKVRQAWPELWGGHHHIGTTRMSLRPERGVVDRDCRIHGIDNLYCAGSSVFATSGYANPTLTIVALAARLAGHLKARYA